MKGETLKDCFAESFTTHQDKTALTFLREGKVETELCYRELDHDSTRMANSFLNLGVEKGDRVVLFIKKSLVFVIAHIALQKIGAIAVPLNSGFKKSEMEYLLQDAEAKLILSEADTIKLIKEIDPKLSTLVIDTQKAYQEIDFFRSGAELPPGIDITSNDAGLIIYTSGTTGKPKGAVLTQNNLVHDAQNIIKIWEIDASDVLCHALPLFHVHGLCFALHTSLIAGSHVLMLDEFSPRQVVNVLSQKKEPTVCSVFMAVPSMYGKLRDVIGDKKLDFGHIRLWTSGSAPLLAQDFERIRDVFGKEPIEREGMSETGMNFSNPLRGQRKPGSVGIPLPALEVRIVDPETMEDVEYGQTGEFWLKGPAVTTGYWRKPEETASAFKQGWFRTGDLGNVDEDGYYYLSDRIKHIIISGGENISPKEVESVINQVEGVVESSVVGIADKKWGEMVVAAVVKKPGISVDANQIKEHCKKHLHNWKCPKAITFANELPRNTMGKVLKEEVIKKF